MYLLLLLVTIRTGQAQDSGGAPRQTIAVYGAGSLRAPMTEIAAEFRKRTHIQVQATFGPSGLLRERIEKGERPDVFASADLSSPQKLVEQRLGTKVEAFTANSVCVIARPDLHVDASNLLDVMLDPKIAIGTSTPKQTPWETTPRPYSPRRTNCGREAKRSWTPKRAA